MRVDLVRHERQPCPPRPRVQRQLDLREVGAGYFDQVVEAISGGESSTLALRGSTEEAQFDAKEREAV